MKCMYCDCYNNAIGDIKGFLVCERHFNILKNVKITNKPLRHPSEYKGELGTGYPTNDLVTDLKKQMGFKSLGGGVE